MYRQCNYLQNMSYKSNDQCGGEFVGGANQNFSVEDGLKLHPVARGSI